jgi:predicted nuclease of predicted toxin-antitoxin system
VKVLVDMNLSPAWIPVLQEAGLGAVHWSRVGGPSAKDPEIMGWARDNDYVLFTHDLGFGALLANTRAGKPSVLQARTQDVAPAVLGPRVVAALRQFASVLADGAVITLDEEGLRARILPLK